MALRPGLFSLALLSGHSQPLPIARPCAMACGFPSPYLLNKTFIKLLLRLPNLNVPVSLGDLINYLSSSAVHFFRHCVLFCFPIFKNIFSSVPGFKKIIEVPQSFLMAACVRTC